MKKRLPFTYIFLLCVLIYFVAFSANATDIVASGSCGADTAYTIVTDVNDGYNEALGTNIRVATICNPKPNSLHFIHNIKLAGDLEVEENLVNRVVKTNRDGTISSVKIAESYASDVLFYTTFESFDSTRNTLRVASNPELKFLVPEYLCPIVLYVDNDNIDEVYDSVFSGVGKANPYEALQATDTYHLWVLAEEHQDPAITDTKVAKLIIISPTKILDAEYTDLENAEPQTNLSWTFDSEGTLTIAGDGEMDSWAYTSTIPWSQYRESIKKVVLENGVTGITNGVFSNCNALTSVSVSNSVTEIGALTFKNCTNLTSVHLPVSLSKISYASFEGCSNLSSVTFHSGVSVIWNNAFSSCSNLTDVYFYGTEEAWNEIFFYSGNDNLLNATIHYLYDYDDSTLPFYGAQIRRQGEQGLRFIFEISKEAYALLSESQKPDDESDTGVGFGSVLLPRKLLGDAPLTKETADAAIVPAVKIYHELEDSILFTVCLTKTLPKNYQQEYVAVPYLTYVDNTGEEITIYGEETTNVTVYNIADLAYNDPNSSNSLKKYLLNNILSLFYESCIYKDVPIEDQPLCKAINLLSELNVMKGTSEIAFSPDLLVNRQQMAEFIYRLMNDGEFVEGGANNTRFVDLDDPTFNYVISWVCQQGIMEGTSDTTFNPHGIVSLQDAYAYLVRALGYEEDEVLLYPFGYIEVAEKIELDNNIPYKLGYPDDVTRGSLAILLANAFYAEKNI